MMSRIDRPRYYLVPVQKRARMNLLYLRVLSQCRRCYGSALIAPALLADEACARQGLAKAIRTARKRYRELLAIEIGP